MAVLEPCDGCGGKHEGKPCPAKSDKPLPPPTEDQIRLADEEESWNLLEFEKKRRKGKGWGLR